MYHFFSNKQALKKKAVSNGGLGGCVALESDKVVVLDFHDAYGRQYYRSPPPVIRVRSNQDEDIEASFETQDRSSLANRRGHRPAALTSSAPVTPQRPSSGRPSFSSSCLSPISPMTTSSKIHLNDALMDSAGTPSTLNFVSPTTAKHSETHAMFLAELPGSLLMPSQGFPQFNPPQTPPRPIPPSRQCSDGSESSSGPSLSTISSVDSDEMDRFRHVSLPRRTLAKLTESAMRNPSIPRSQSMPLRKSYSDMSFEDLMECLPNCPVGELKPLWMPAMQQQCVQLKTLLQQVAERRVDIKSSDQNLTRTLNTFTSSFQTIANVYYEAVSSADQLANRDDLALKDGLSKVKRQLAIANEALNRREQEIVEQDIKMTILRQRLSCISDVFIDLVEDNVICWTDLAKQPNASEVLHFVTASASQDHDDLVQYSLESENSHTVHLQRLRETRADIREHQETLMSQAEVIQTQSEQLDQHVERFEKYLQAMEEKQHEIVLLAHKNEALTQRLEECKTVLRNQQNANLDFMTLLRDFELMQKQLDRLRIESTGQLDERDAEIRVLRHKLTCVIDHAAVERDRNKATSEAIEALLSQMSDPQSSDRSNSPAVASLSLPKEKGRYASLPSSNSMISFALPRLDADLMMDTRKPTRNLSGSPPNARSLPSQPIAYRDQSPSSRESVKRRRRASESSVSVQLMSDVSSDMNRPIPPPKEYREGMRADGASNTLNQHLSDGGMREYSADPPLIPPRHNIHKPPSGQIESESQILPNPTMPYPGYHASGKRNLSDIPELDKEDNNSIHANSIDSIDREVYRRSIAAFDLLNTNMITAPPISMYNTSQQNHSQVYHDSNSHSTRHANVTDASESSVTESFLEDFESGE